MGHLTAELTDLLRSGVRLDFSDARGPIFRVDKTLRSRVDALLAPACRSETQAVLQRMTAYRDALLVMFSFITLEATRTVVPLEALEQWRAAYQQEIRLTDDLGTDLSDALRAQVALDYRHTTGLCPLCGNEEHAR